jgi:hypothetical protein
MDELHAGDVHNLDQLATSAKSEMLSAVIDTMAIMCAQDRQDQATSSDEYRLLSKWS